MLNGKFSGQVSAVSKEKCWRDLAAEVSAVSGVQRMSDEIKKKWQCLKSDAKTTAMLARKQLKSTGGGERVNLEVNGSQAQILGIMGSVCVDGVAGGFDSAVCQMESLAGMLYFMCSVFVETCIHNQLLLLLFFRPWQCNIAWAEEKISKKM